MMLSALFKTDLRVQKCKIAANITATAHLGLGNQRTFIKGGQRDYHYTLQAAHPLSSMIWTDMN